MVITCVDKEYEKKFAKNVDCEWIRVLGTGSYGVISLVKKFVEGREKEIVLKRLSLSSKYQEEYEVHKHLWDEGGCENIIKIFSMKEFDQDVAIFLEYAEDGDILPIVPFLRRSRIQSYFRQLIAGLEYIHSKGVVHRDIKPDNLFLTKESVLKIGDFGLSEFYENENGSFGVLAGAGSREYAAPEVFLQDVIEGPPTDIWSAGLVLLNMLSNDHPWQAACEDDEEYQKYIKNDLKDMKLVWEFIDEKPKALVLKMLTVKPDQRATIQEIQNNQWFNDEVID